MKNLLIIAIAAASLVLAACSKSAGPGAVSGHGPEVVITSEDMFASNVESGQGVVLVDFWATWCPPCKYMNPILAGLAKEYEGRLTVAKVDVDQNPKLAERFKIQSIPTLILFKDGKAVDMRVGAVERDDLVAWFTPHLGG